MTKVKWKEKSLKKGPTSRKTTRKEKEILSNLGYCVEFEKRFSFTKVE